MKQPGSTPDRWVTYGGRVAHWDDSPSQAVNRMPVAACGAVGWNVRAALPTTKPCKACERKVTP